jgi:acyl carrier protein
MWDDARIASRLTSIFRDVFDDDGMVVTRELAAGSVDGWDSLTHVRLILSVERGFDVKFSASEVARLKNAGDLLDLIAARLRTARS